MVPLLVRSHYSLFFGTAAPAALCKAARRLGFRQLALTDRDNLYGLHPFLRACRAEGIIPVVGAEVTTGNSGKGIICLVESGEGYGNLCRLLTARHGGRDFDLVREVERRQRGLTVMTTDPVMLQALWAAGIRTVAALAVRPTTASSGLHRLAGRLGAPSAVVPDAFMLDREDHEVHQLLRAICRRSSLSRLAAGDIESEDGWLAGEADYRQRFAVWPEVVEETRRIADRCRFRGPAFGVVMPSYGKLSRLEADGLLRQEAYFWARYRYGEDLSGAVVSRLEKELQIIADKGFSAYFLVVRDIVHQRWQPDDSRYQPEDAPLPRICGRGSGAASLVAYCLRITNVCPIKHNLYFERFLNPGRVDPPDIDVDFAWDERDDLLASVLRQYGDRAAMVASHILFQPRMAIRETARAFGMPEHEIRQQTRDLDSFWRPREAGALFSGRGEVQERFDRDFHQPWPEIIRLAGRLLGIPRYLAVHPGGVIITPEPVTAYVPVQFSAKGVPIIQWEKDSAEEAGLVKIDLLGNRSLGVIRDAVANIRGNQQDFDENGWQPEDDAATQSAIGRGRTMGCFYIESPAMRLLQRKAGRGDFENLVLQSSIIRPAASEYIREYVRRLHGGDWPKIPLLDEVLKETYGLMVYQEDVSRVAVALAGFSHSQADGLRKILSKKDKSRQLQDFRQQFAAGAAARGLTAGDVENIWQMIMSFSGYSFCKPHSASYARVSFQAAYLKTHFPAEFMAAVISNQGGFYSTFAYVSEARRQGMRLRPVDVNESDICWQGSENAIRVGLMAVKKLSTRTMQRIVLKRQQGGFETAADFFYQVRPEEEEGRWLILAGGLDRFSGEANRSTLLWQFAYWLQQRKRRWSAGAIGAGGGLAPPQLPPEKMIDRRRREFAALGFLYDCHPLTLLKLPSWLKTLQTVKAGELERFAGRLVHFLGWLITGKKIRDSGGQDMEFVTFEDDTGLVEAVMFPRVYERYCHMLTANRPYLVAGRPELDFGVVTFTVQSVEPVAAGKGESSA